jgi:predicted TIM-barrel fold metal-dependent hydrolase
MLYNGVFRRYPNIKFIFAHSGGAVPVLSGHLGLLGAEAWVPNPENLTKEEIKTQLGRLHVDTAATAETGLAPALKMVGKDRCIYGADCGVLCSTTATMEENRISVLKIEEEHGLERSKIGFNGFALFPGAAEQARKGGL